MPHYNSESDRKKSLKRMVKKHHQVAIALEDYTALQIQGEQCRILRAQPSAEAYLVYFKAGKFYEIKIDGAWQSLNGLLQKKLLCLLLTFNLWGAEISTTASTD